MRLQLAINVSDLDAAIEFYGKALGAELNKREPGYANFVLDNPALKLVLFESESVSDRLNHLGFEVFDDAQLDVAAHRLAEAGLEHDVRRDETCCYATQNKVWAIDPQGTRWEYYRIIEDSETFGLGSDFEAKAAPEPTIERCCG